MKPSPTMQQTIQLLAERHGINLSEQGTHLHLTMKGYEPLVIESISMSRVVVAHYFPRHGDLVPDPRVTFFTGDPIGWIPIGITQSIGRSRTYAVLSEDGTKLVCLNRRSQADLAAFTEMWAHNLLDQQWVTHGQPVPTSLFPLGAVKTLEAGLQRYFALYNYERPHQSLRNQTPAEWYHAPPA